MADRWSSLLRSFMVTLARRFLVFFPSLLNSANSFGSWNHFTNEELKNNHDDLLRAEVGLPEVSYVFQYISH